MLNTCVIYGKLPAYGDFLQRGLNAAQLQVWDAWLQNFIASSQLQLGDNWLDVYLCSPIWRFALSSGVLDEHAWLGLLLPSVDKVGRYFPFTVLKALPENTAITEALQSAETWFVEQEKLCLEALQQPVNVDEFKILLDKQACKVNFSTSVSSFNQQVYASHVSSKAYAQHGALAQSQLLHQHLRLQYGAYSVWQTQGSNLVSPSLFSAKGLPETSMLTAMLDGDWAASGWASPDKVSGASTEFAAISAPAVSNALNSQVAMDAAVEINLGSELSADLDVSSDMVNISSNSERMNSEAITSTDEFGDVLAAPAAESKHIIGEDFELAGSQSSAETKFTIELDESDLLKRNDETNELDSFVNFDEGKL